ncbi:N-formylglutamate amidohydrolase [Chelativorans sp.]|uniref:N-formylglutamate amidohydrolase n=1 Tax=Chelativorans sp. TaxID=2203393 RepID=UPI002811ABCA|nr:N-formylglutamate amidohydrolase [Chelativorans sp.]
MTSLTAPKQTIILAPDEPHPLETRNEQGRSGFVLICEHAGRLMPRSLGTLGLGEEDLVRHIAWDIGARAVAVALSDMLDAPLFMQRYSRLVCDCNRRPDVPSFAPEVSEATQIPGNVALSEAARQARAEAIFWPFHDAVTAFLDRRQAEGRPTVLATIHTFTPVFLGVQRPWEIGVLYNRDREFAPAVARWLQETTDHTVGINEPYKVSDDTDYAIPVHGEKRGLPCVEFEIRNDLITGETAGYWAKLLATVLTACAPAR